MRTFESERDIHEAALLFLLRKKELSSGIVALLCLVSMTDRSCMYMMSRAHDKRMLLSCALDMYSHHSTGCEQPQYSVQL